MIADIEEMKLRINAVLDVTEFLDLVGYELADLLELMEEQIEDNYDALNRATR